MTDAGLQMPPSPTAGWRHTIVSTEHGQGPDATKRPYLPHPYPLKRRGRERGGHPGGFQSLQTPLQPPKRPDPVHSTYAEWWHDQQPHSKLEDPDQKTFSTCFWPYGRRITAVAPTDHPEAAYLLDDRIIKHQVTYAHRREPRPDDEAKLSRSQSAAELFGSSAEALGYSRSFNRSFGTSALRFAGAQPKTAPRLSMRDLAAHLESTRQLSEMPRTPSDAGTARSQELTATPPMRRSQSQPGSTKYEPHRSLRAIGLGHRTHSEWRLPQAEDIHRASGV